MLIFLVLFLITAAFILLKRQYSHWQNLGFPTEEPVIPYGNIGKVFRKERPFGLVMSDIYENFQDKVVGIYLFFKPALMIRDAEVVRQIMTSDFGSFHDRGLYVDEEHDPMSANLFTLKAQKWRALRAKLTPSFTSGKLKGMFQTVDDVADKLIAHISEQLKDGKTHTLEMKSLTTTA